MSKLRTSCIGAALIFLGAALAQAQQTPQRPEPATQPTEGTAADRTRPGATPTETAPTQEEDPRPSTSETEGTAADSTPPGRASTTQGAATQRGAQRSELVGAAVVTNTEAPLGEVVDVVFDAKNQPAFVVISTEGKSVAVPYSVATSMKTSDKIVMDRARLQGAPKVKEGEWKTMPRGGWKDESARYWNRG
jgi:sporulation protein YlmC with PRC-barrel domain